jgi:hypothetical protein
MSGEKLPTTSSDKKTGSDSRVCRPAPLYNGKFIKPYDIHQPRTSFDGAMRFMP